MVSLVENALQEAGSVSLAGLNNSLLTAKGESRLLQDSGVTQIQFNYVWTIVVNKKKRQPAKHTFRNTFVYV